MIPVTLYFKVQRMGGKHDSYRKTQEFSAVPRVGDRIELTDGGWSEVVRDVWWNFDGSALIEFEPHVSDDMIEAGYVKNQPYVTDEELKVLPEAGWEKI